MKDSPMQEDESALIEEAIAAIATLKKAMAGIHKINEDAERFEAADDVMALRGGLMIWHRDASAAMRKHWPEYASELRGPGR